MKREIKAFTREQHLLFSYAARTLSSIYLSVGDKQLAKQWMTTAIQHREAAIRLVAKEGNDGTTGK